MAQNDRDKGPLEQIGEAVGGMAGRAAQQATDVTLGVAGAVFGTATQLLGDWWGTPQAQQASRSFGDRQDAACREHFTRSGTGAGASSSASTTGRSYETARPLYQFGHTARHNPGYQGRSFREVEPELERAWGEDQARSYGAWPEVRSYVSYGFDQSTDIVRESREAGLRAQGGGSSSESDIRSASRDRTLD